MKMKVRNEASVAPKGPLPSKRQGRTPPPPPPPHLLTCCMKMERRKEASEKRARPSPEGSA